MPDTLPEALRAHTFTPETAKVAGRRSAEVRRAKREAQRRDQQHLRTLAQAFDRDTLGPLALRTATEVVAKVLTGEIPVRNGAEAAAVVNALVTIGRLEAGEATSHSLSASLSADQVREALASRLAGGGDLPGPSAPGGQVPPPGV